MLKGATSLGKQKSSFFNQKYELNFLLSFLQQSWAHCKIQKYQMERSFGDSTFLFSNGVNLRCHKKKDISLGSLAC